MLNLEKT